MTIYALRTTDTREWVGITTTNIFCISNVPVLFDKNKWSDEHWEFLCFGGGVETGHPCEWVEVELTVKGEQPVKAYLPALLLAGKLATAARMVTKANARSLSLLVEQMESALDAYDNEIIRISK